MATMNDSISTRVAVVMVPLPAQGHLNQLLQLSRLIAANDIPVHYVCTATHIHQTKLRVHGWDPRAAANLHFHDLPIPEFQTPCPNPNAANKFPSHLQPLFNAASQLRRPLAGLLHSLSHTSHRVVVIHDSLMSSVVQDVVSIQNAESYIFHSVSAFSVFWYFQESPDINYPFPVEDYEIKEQIPSLEDCFTSEFMEFIISEQKYIGLISGSLYNTSRVVEGKYMDLIEKMSENDEKPEISGNKKQWALGPFNPVDNIIESGSRAGPCLEWLDGLGPNSVIFVSFGTTTTLSDKQIQELAMGLERSEQKFIWVLRDADSGDVFSGNNNNNNNNVKKIEILPKGFEERVKERGIIVRDWAPQLKILGHCAIGGFMSHCGWNSCMESISMGVPIAAWPMHSDQPRNAVLVTKILRIGIVVRNWDHKDEIVKSSVVESVVRRLMASEEGVEVRKRAAELGSAIREAVAEGGSTRLELESFISHITR
ncbi:hypothetical protein DH2020_016652 [Rehmannia glutinosa]|uniref:Glycosyltransferase n=1 Tax=Rehmannia glutinosa TaxID=99300 RepID=A0ABR0WS25_REHGL